MLLSSTVLYSNNIDLIEPLPSVSIEAMSLKKGLNVSPLSAAKESKQEYHFPQLEGALDIPAGSFGEGPPNPPFLELARDLNEWNALEKVK
jgi:hypothetical protein